MSFDAVSHYSEALQARRKGLPSHADGSTPFVAAKPEFYADSRQLIDDVRLTYASYKQVYPPYGLLTPTSEAVTELHGSSSQKWIQLERVMAATATKAFDETSPKTQSYPYHETLRNLGSISLTPIDGNQNGLDRLREITVPGAVFAPATIVNLLHRIPAMAAMTGVTDSHELLARASKRSLLQEPLHHPQQYAKAFTFCLTDGYMGRDIAFRRERFMPDDVIADYVHLQKTIGGREMVGWSKPTLDFRLRAAVNVADRLEGPENDLSGDHVTTYPIGTRLGDIKVTEPTIGCPGNQMAYDMWNQAIDVIVSERLWD